MCGAQDFLRDRLRRKPTAGKIWVGESKNSEVSTVNILPGRYRELFLQIKPVIMISTIGYEPTFH